MSFWDNSVWEEADKEQSDFSPIPAGDYTVILVDAELKATKAGNGHYLNCRFDVVEGEFKGRMIFCIINVNNANPQATGIGMSQLKMLATAAGKLKWYEHLKECDTWSDAEAYFNATHAHLGNIPVVAKVSIKRDEQYGDKNDIKRFSQIESKAPSAAKTSAKKSDPFGD